jgi:hypothetical protein
MPNPLRFSESWGAARTAAAQAWLRKPETQILLCRRQAVAQICESKRAFAELWRAEAVARSLNRKAESKPYADREIAPYRCEHCRKFHVGHPPLSLIAEAAE